MTVFKYFEHYLAELQDGGKLRAVEKQKTTLNRLREYRGGVDFDFGDIDGGMMQHFEAWMRERGLADATIGFYFRTFRTVYLRAVADGLTENRNPFAGVYTGKGNSTVSYALSRREILALSRHDFSYNSLYDFVRNIFMFSYYADGMDFVDIAYLKKSDLQGNRLTYVRRKSGFPITVKVNQALRQLLNRFEKNPREYLLPIIIYTDRDERRQYHTYLEIVNSTLKTVAAIVGVNPGLCLSMARHTWSIEHRDVFPIHDLSRQLGCGNLFETRKYLSTIIRE